MSTYIEPLMVIVAKTCFHSYHSEMLQSLHSVGLFYSMIIPVLLLMNEFKLQLVVAAPK